jgi:hypothetical protein
MRRWTTVGLLLVVSLSLATVAIPVCDYRSPETSLTELGLLMNYRYFDDGATPMVDVSSGRVEMDYSRLFDSPDLGYSLAGLLKVSLVELMPSELLMQGSGTLRLYFGADSLWYGFGGFEGSSSLAAANADVRAGIGVGRFTDVTPLAKAISISEKLISLGILADPLGDDVLLSIAETIGREIEFTEMRELVTAIESDIEGPLGVELGSEALLWIQEIVERGGDTRKCGWSMQGGVGYEVLDSSGEAGDILVTLSADAAWSLGPRHQFVGHVGLSGPVALLSEITMNANASYELDLSEDVELTSTFAWRRVTGAGGQVRTDWSETVSFRYDLDGADLGVQFAVGREAMDARPTVEMSLTLSMELI